MSCGGNRHLNANARVLSECVEEFSGQNLTRRDMAARFHVLTRNERDRLVEKSAIERDRVPGRVESTRITQRAHAYARANLRASLAKTVANQRSDAHRRAEQAAAIAPQCAQVHAAAVAAARAGAAPATITPGADHTREDLAALRRANQRGYLTGVAAYGRDAARDGRSHPTTHPANAHPAAQGYTREALDAGYRDALSATARQRGAEGERVGSIPTSAEDIDANYRLDDIEAAATGYLAGISDWAARRAHQGKMCPQFHPGVGAYANSEHHDAVRHALTSGWASGQRERSRQHAELDTAA